MGILRHEGCTSENTRDACACSVWNRAFTHTGIPLVVTYSNVAGFSPQVQYCRVGEEG